MPFNYVLHILGHSTHDQASRFTAPQYLYTQYIFRLYDKQQINMTGLAMRAFRTSPAMVMRRSNVLAGRVQQRGYATKDDLGPSKSIHPPSTHRVQYHHPANNTSTSPSPSTSPTHCRNPLSYNQNTPVTFTSFFHPHPYAQTQPYPHSHHENLTDTHPSTTTDKEHTTNKPSHDVQAESSNKAQAAASDPNDTSSGATSGKDTNNSNKKAKEEFPEAPDTIGMQDEKGGKGVH